MNIGSTIDFGRLRHERRMRLLAEMDRQGLDLLVLLGAANQEYAGVSRPSSDAMRIYYEPNVVLLSATGEIHVWTWYPEAVFDVPADHIHRGLPVELEAGAKALHEAISSVAADARRIAIDELTSPMIATIDQQAPQVEFVDASVVTVPARLVKTRDEIECLRVSQALTETAMYDVQAALRPGVKQNELSAIFLRRCFELGMTWNCIDPIWNITPRTYADGVRTTNGDVGFPLSSDDRFLRDGDLILCDVGVVWNGYHSDFGKTWLVGFGAQPDKELQAHFDRWRTLIDVVYAGVRPGRTCADLARDAKTVEPEFALSHFYLGHGVGCDSAEMPFIGSELGPELEDAIELVPGMVFILEPVIWTDGIGGFRSEELIVVTTDGYERLSTYGYAPFD